ncbi:Rv1535 domain-containing protein [Mycobacterium sp.]|uniref:Rv1535 domain-containing protein n=1 Tax=Mycobacterium sp. TaxID=1785 RepID=UPI003C71C559
MTDSGGDPLVSSIALVLRVPLLELYALLWRFGVVEIRHPGRRARRSAGAHQVVVVACATCPNLPKPGSGRLSRWSPQRQTPALVPSRQDPAVCSRAIG